MSEEQTSARLSILWSEEARGDLRRIDRQTALDILHCANRYLASRNGDVKKLKPPQTGFRLAAATTGSSSSTRTKPPSRSSVSGIDAKLIAE